MMNVGTCCQVCSDNFFAVHALKIHLTSKKHCDKTKEIFNEVNTKSAVTLPHIDTIDKKTMHCNYGRIVGLRSVTLCISLETMSCFYLCHICEDKPPPLFIMNHLLSSDHCSNYFSYTNPDSLIFSWLPSMNMSSDLNHALRKEVNQQGTGFVKILDLPQKLFEKVEQLPYSKVMQTLRENEKLAKVLEESIPKRTFIQRYKDDSNRKHPLLGLQHLVECVRAGATEQRHYLCKLCKITVASHKVNKHLLGLDHIYCYFSVLHPSTLLSRESYKDCKFFAYKLLKIAKGEESETAATNELKTVTLEPDEYASVASMCYSEALKRVERFLKGEKKEKVSSVPSVQPEKEEEKINVVPNIKLETKEVNISVVPSVKAEKCEEKISDVTSFQLEKKPEFPTEGLLYKIRCQDCSMAFDDTSKYFQHLETDEHIRMVKRFFGGAHMPRDDPEGWKPRLGLHIHVQESLKRNQPVVGAPLVVACVTSFLKSKTLYLCIACEESFTDTSLKPHLNSTNHLLKTLLHQNPWHLPFAWKDTLDLEEMRSKAWQDEREREPSEMTLKVLDIIPWIFNSMGSFYEEVMSRLRPWYTLIMGEVPPPNTLCKLEQKKFPLLGRQFLVTHDFRQGQVKSTGHLCLLCCRILPKEEASFHVFSWEHVARFLNKFHPGSVTPQTDAGTLLDLADQAASVHGPSSVQIIKLERPINQKCSYSSVTYILECVKRKAGQGALDPQVTKRRKLIPRKTMKDMDKGKENEATAAEKGATIAAREEPAKEDHVGVAQSMAGLDAVTGSPDSDSQQEITLWQFLKRKEREPVIGLSALLECNCNRHEPIYFCKCCSLKIALADLISHVIGHEHQKKYLKELEELPPIPEMDEVEIVRHFGILFERDMGYGEAQVIDVEEEVYNIISKQDFESGMKTLKALTPELYDVQTVEMPPTPHPQHGPPSLLDNLRVTDMEIDSEREETEPAPEPAAVSVMTQTSSTPQVPLQPNTQVNITEIKVCETDDKENIQQTVFRSNKDKNVSTRGTNTTPLDPDSTGSDCKVEWMEVASTLNIMETSQSTSTQDLIRNAPPESQMPTSKCPSPDPSPQPNISTASVSTCVITTNQSNAHKCGASTPSAAATTSSSFYSASLSGMTATTSVHMSNLLKSTDAGSPLDVSPASYTQSPVREEATSSTKPHFDSQNATISPKITGTCQPTAEIALESDNYKHVDESAETAPVQKSARSTAEVPPNNHKSYSFAVPNLHPPLLTPKPENVTPPAKPSHTSTSEVQPVGINQLIKVRCEERKQIYCTLCWIKLKSSKHTVSYDHQLNYVKKKFPDWTPNHDKLDKIVAHLAEAEKDIGPQSFQTIDVNIEAYKMLAALPEHIAIERLKDMLKRKESRIQSSTAHPAEVLREMPATTSPCEVTTPDYELRNKPEFQTPLDQIPGRFPQAPETCPDPFDRRLDQQKSTQKVKHVPKQAGPMQPEVYKASRISTKENPEVSNLSTYLKVKGAERQVIGLGFVWECQGIALKSFFLCESCQKTLFINDIYQHLVSFNHLLNYMLRAHRDLLLDFWWEEDLPLSMREELFLDVVQKISEREHANRTDAQCIALRKDLHDYVRKAPFNEALEMLRGIKRKQKTLSISCQPISTQQQKNLQPDSREKCLPRVTHSAKALETQHRSNNEARQQAHEQHSEETTRVGHLNNVQRRSTLDGTSVSLKTDSVISTFSGNSKGPEKISRSLSIPTPPPASQHQSPPPEMPVKLGELNSQLPSSSVANPDINPTPPVPPVEKCLLTGKRAAVASIDTLIGADNPETGCNVPHKRACISSQPGPQLASELAPINPSATIKNTGPTPAHQNKPTEGIQFDHLIALLRETKSSMSLSQSGVERGDNENVPNTEKRLHHAWTVAAIVQQNEPSPVPPTESDLSAARPPEPPKHEVLSFEAANSKAGQSLQPQDTAARSSTGVGQSAITAIVTARPDPSEKPYMNPTEENRGEQATYSTATTASVSVTEAGSSVYDQYTQAYVNSGQGYMPPEAFMGYTAPSTPFYNGSFCQPAGYTAWMYYPGQMYPNSQQSPGQPSAAASSAAWASFDLRQQMLMQLYYPGTAPASGNMANGATYFNTAQSNATQNNPQVVPYYPPTAGT